MATLGSLQRVSSRADSATRLLDDTGLTPSRASQSAVARWMFVDAITVAVSAVVAVLLVLYLGPVLGARDFYHGTLFRGNSLAWHLAILAGFIVALLAASQSLKLYKPPYLSGFLHEQRLSMQACLLAGLLLMGSLYLIHSVRVPRIVVLVTLLLATVSLSLRRLVYRILLHRRFDRGIDTRNVLIVGTGPVAHALRRQLERTRHLGYSFKGFVAIRSGEDGKGLGVEDVAGDLKALFPLVRQHFVDEILVAARCDGAALREMVEEARACDVDLRVVPDNYDGVTSWSKSIEYIGQFPTIPLHQGRVSELGLLLKRMFDVVFCALGVVALAPLYLVIALLIKLDSPGPVFYASDRIGKKGRAFRCFKFRTMVRDAEQRQADLMYMNERDGVLFKVSNDPRVTRVGRLLRKYSLDELPQFFNVLRGEMSLVGPRPPLASEVKQYKLGHLRRLNVLPGITGLWQVEARHDPSFDSYVSWDMAYIEDWSIWLDMKIMVRTVGVVLSGTGT